MHHNRHNMTSLLQRFVYSMDILRRNACFKLNKLATKLGHHQQKERKSRNESCCLSASFNTGVGEITFGVLKQTLLKYHFMLVLQLSILTMLYLVSTI